MHKGEKTRLVVNYKAYHLSEAVYIAQAYKMFPVEVRNLVEKHGQHNSLTVNVLFLSGRYNAPISISLEVYNDALKPLIDGKANIRKLSHIEVSIADTILTTMAQENSAINAIGRENTKSTLDTLIARINLPRIKEKK